MFDIDLTEVKNKKFECWKILFEFYAEKIAKHPE